MKVVNVQGLKVDQFDLIPKNLNWIGNVPSSYSINIMRNKSNTKSIIALTDSFGGGVAYTLVENHIYPVDMGRELDKDEEDFIKRVYPNLWKEIIN